jgi:hypothetical protein
MLQPALVDCEQLRSGLVAQPANSVSSLAFIVAGVWIVGRARRLTVNGDAAVIALVAVAVGIGSVAFHGVADAPSHWLHDTTLLVLLSLVAVKHVGPRTLALSRAAPLLGVGAGSVVLASPNSTTLVAIMLVLCVVASEVALTLRHGSSTIQRSLALMLAFGLLASWLGRTGSVLCRPESVLQLHALWHVTMAVAAAWWVECAIFNAPVACAALDVRDRHDHNRNLCVVRARVGDGSGEGTHDAGVSPPADHE